MVKKHLGLSEKDFDRAFSTIPNLHQILEDAKSKLLSFIANPVEKLEVGASIFESIIIQKDGSSKTNYDFLSSEQRSDFAFRYEKGYYYSQVKIFESLFDRRNELQSEIIEHALFLVFAQKGEFLRNLKPTQIPKILTIMKNLFFVDMPDNQNNEIELLLSQYHLDRSQFNQLKIQSIKSYLSYFSDKAFTDMYCDLFGVHSPEILEQLLACYEKFKLHLPNLFALYENNSNKAYWFIKNKFQTSCLTDMTLLETPYKMNSEGNKYFHDADTYNAFLSSSRAVLDVITTYPKSKDSEPPVNGKKLALEHINASYSIFNTQSFYIANSKFKKCFVSGLLKICFSNRFFIFKKLNETRHLTVDPLLATKALDLIYEQLLQYSDETIRHLSQVINGEKPKKPDAVACKFIDEMRLLEMFISDNQVFNGVPSLISNLNLIKNIYTYSDLVQISLDWHESFNMHQKLKVFAKNIKYNHIDFSDFHEQLVLLDKDFYSRGKCKDLFPDCGSPERLTSFLFSCRLSSQYVVFYIKVKRIFDQYVLDVAKTPTGSSVRSEEANLSFELVRYLNKNEVKLTPDFDNTCSA